MTQRNDGGPAFPIPCEDDRNCNPRFEAGYGGMTLRDYFAAKTEGLHEDAAPEYAEALTGRKRPDVASDSPANMLEWARFWADADAAHRYMRADAMLAEREKGQ